MSAGSILLHLSRPHFGQLVTWVLLGFCLVLAALPMNYVSGERIGPATVISFLPDSLAASPVLYQATRLTLLVSAVLWAIQRYVPWTCWLTVGSFTALWALRMENTYHAAHIFNITNMLLLIHAAWYQFYVAEISESLRGRRFWTTALYPRWAFLLSVFYIGLFHSLAGLSKLLHSGLAWGDGVSLQLWVHLFGWRDSPVSELLLGNSTFAAVIQTSTLVIETAAILAIIPHLRTVVGVALMGLYFGILTTFVDFGFHFNAVLVGMFLLPLEPLLRRIKSTAMPESLLAVGRCRE